MLQDQLKALRKEKGLTQEERAIRLTVVRQTVSKWEKGLSVPDAQILLKLAEIFECPVSRLLGSEPETAANTDGIAEQLSRINEQLAVKNRRARRLWKIAAILLAVFLLGQVLLMAVSYVAVDRYAVQTQSAVEVVEEDRAE
ncbi:MAG: helix-turn-helix transcriptional regulator [Oscillospiraceae bacterium]|nr:helix-turn-helix transcriptional regulator [Oscillospiraceae bacterium]